MRCPAPSCLPSSTIPARSRRRSSAHHSHIVRAVAGRARQRLSPAAAAVSAGVRQWDFRAYDLIVSSSHCVAKGVDARGKPHLTYCHTPMRYIWDRFDDYFPALRAVAPRGDAVHRAVAAAMGRAHVAGGDAVPGQFDLRARSHPALLRPGRRRSFIPSSTTPFSTRRWWTIARTTTSSFPRNSFLTNASTWPSPRR